MKDLFELGCDVADAVAELLVLWPRLAAALVRDQVAPEGERVTSSRPAPAMPVNADVIVAIAVLQADAWMTEWAARELVHEPRREPGAPTVDGSLRAMPRLFQRMVDTNAHPEARRLAGTVLRWHRLVRQAIGLSRHSRPLTGRNGPVYCPLHDDRLAILRQCGDEGTLVPGQGVDLAVTWRSGEGIYCPASDCEGRWGQSEFGLLGRLVRAAEHRRRLQLLQDLRRQAQETTT